MDDLLTDVSLLSLDVFDTILFRRCLTPVDVFSWIERTSGEVGFAADRVAAEREARRRHKSRGAEVSIEEIYEVMRSSRTVAQDAIQRELDAEARFLVASETVAALIEQARRKGIRVVALSDIYLSAAQVQQLLSGCSVDVDAVYTSADLRDRNLGKHNGAVYPYLLTVEDVPTNAVLHVGDNPISDVENADRAGIAAVQVFNLHDLTAQRSDHVAEAVRSATTPTGRIVAGQLAHGLAARGWTSSDLRSYAYCYGGPLLLGMTLFMQEVARTRDIRRFILLERDGNILKEALDRLGFEAAEYRLVPSSRRMAVFPLVNMYGFERIASLFIGNPKQMTEADFFRLLNIDPPDFPGPRNTKHTPQEHYTRHERYLLGRAEDEQAAQRRIFSEELEMFRRGENVAWFDVGWALSSAAALNELLDVPWPCLCIGSHEQSANDLPQAGYLFEHGHPEQVSRPVMTGPEVIELVFSTDIPSAAYAVPDGEAGWHLVTQPDGAAARLRNVFVRDVWCGALAFLDDIHDLVPGLHEGEMRDFNREMFRSLCASPTRNQNDILAAVPHTRLAGNGHWKRIGDYWAPPIRDGGVASSDVATSALGRKRRPIRDFVSYHVLKLASHDIVPISTRTRDRFRRSAAKRVPTPRDSVARNA